MRYSRFRRKPKARPRRIAKRRYGRGLLQDNRVGFANQAQGNLQRLVNTASTLNEVYKQTKPFRDRYYGPPRAPNWPNRPPGAPRYPSYPPPRAPAKPPSKRAQRSFVRINATHMVGNASIMALNMTPRVRQTFYRSFASTKQTITRMNTFMVTSTVGNQGHATVPLMDSALTMIVAPPAPPGIPDVSKEINNMFEVSRNVLTPNAMTVQQSRRQQLWVDSMSNTFKCVNTTNTPCKLTVRVIRVLEKTNWFPENYWDLCTRMDDNADDDLGTIEGWGSYVTADTPAVPDSNPRHSKFWRRKFHMTHQKTINMDAGDETQFTVLTQYFKPMLSTDIWNPGILNEDGLADQENSAQNRSHHPAWTFFVMFTVLGGKMQTESDIMTYGEGQVSIYQTTKTRFYNYPYRQNGVYLLNQIQTGVDPASLKAFDAQDAGEDSHINKKL